MNTQPEALRLADWLETDIPPNDTTTCADVAAELRRLQAENEALKAELQEQAPINGMGAERELALMAEAKAAYAQGQRDMREKAADVCETEAENWHEDRGIYISAESIRALPIGEKP